jgi:hypothetical protein
MGIDLVLVHAMERFCEHFYKKMKSFIHGTSMVGALNTRP